MRGAATSRPRTFRDTGLLPLLRLRADECKWPVSHHVKAIGGHLFCGGRTNGRPYCAKHQMLNLSSSRPRHSRQQTARQSAASKGRANA